MALYVVHAGIALCARAIQAEIVAEVQKKIENAKRMGTILVISNGITWIPFFIPSEEREANTNLK